MILTSDQTDALAEIVNIGVGRAASSLSDLLGERIELTVPNACVVSIEDLTSGATPEYAGLDTSIIQDFRGNASGRAVLAFPKESALKLGQILGGLDDVPEEFDIDIQDLLNEVGNIVLNGVLGTFGNLMGSCLSYTVPSLGTETCISELVYNHLNNSDFAERAVLVANALFQGADRNISGSLILIVDAASLETIVNSMLGPSLDHPLSPSQNES